MAAAAPGVSLSAECCFSLLNAMVLSRDNLRGRRFLKRPLLSRPLQAVFVDQSDDCALTSVTLNTGM